MGGCDHASPLPAHEGRAFYLPADCYRDPIGFFRRLRTTFWGGRKNDERDPWPSHCRGLRASLCQRRGGISSASPCIGDHIRGLDRRVGSSISLVTVPFSQRSLEGACGKAVRCGIRCRTVEDDAPEFPTVITLMPEDPEIPPLDFFDVSIVSGHAGT